MPMQRPVLVLSPKSRQRQKRVSRSWPSKSGCRRRLCAKHSAIAVSSSGFVVHTLEAALWAVGTTTCFEDAVVRAVNLGDDADTVGAVAGQLAGARYGASAIPARWLSMLVKRELVEDCADALAAACDADDAVDADADDVDRPTRP